MNSTSIKSLRHQAKEDFELHLVFLDSQIRLFNDPCVDQVSSIGTIISALENLLASSPIKSSKKKKKLIENFLVGVKDSQKSLYQDPLVNVLPPELFDTILQSLLNDTFAGDSNALTKLIAYKNTSKVASLKTMIMLKKLFSHNPANFFQNLCKLTPTDLLRFIQAFFYGRDSLYQQVEQLAQKDNDALLCFAMITKDITKLDSKRLEDVAIGHSFVYVDAILSFLKKEEDKFLDILFRRRQDMSAEQQIYLNLAGADLSLILQKDFCVTDYQCGLQHIDLSFANLTGTKMENPVIAIKLEGAYLEGASLKGMKLNRDLSVDNASFRSVDLTGADGLQHCYGVDFQGAKLSCAKSLDINDTNKVSGAIFFDKEDVVSWGSLDKALTQLNGKLSDNKSDFIAVQNLLSAIASDFLRSLQVTDIDAENKIGLIKAVKEHSIIKEKRKEPKKKPTNHSAFFKPAKDILSEAEAAAAKAVKSVRSI